ncbi:MAG: nitroreductase family protein [Muribaculaceae bacterium]|nr:nitroreductase family protein [Muribaculaceae bacterium]MDE6631501.1 nitroreductase family protein [Muribaculaceae bacterium]
MEKDYFANRKSVRNYTKLHIPEELLDSILERAMRAPTCGNMQLYSVIVTREPEKLARLSQEHFNQPAATGADVILTICADFNRFTQWCESSGAKPGYNNFHSFIMALTDAVIYAQQIVTIAETEGLGTCYLGTVNYNAKQISEILELPDLVVPVASLSLGYPENPEEDQCERLPLEAVRHNETYSHASKEEILELFKAKDDFEPNKKFVEENKKDSLAQVFTDIRYPESVNKAVSESFLTLLKEKGFI